MSHQWIKCTYRLTNQKDTMKQIGKKYGCYDALCKAEQAEELEAGARMACWDLHHIILTSCNTSQDLFSFVQLSPEDPAVRLMLGPNQQLTDEDKRMYSTTRKGPRW